MVSHHLGLLKYFKLCSNNSCDLPLPDLGGSFLSITVDFNTIEEANNEVTAIIADSLLHSIAVSPNNRYPLIKLIRNPRTQMFVSNLSIITKAFRLIILQNVVPHVLITVSIYTREHDCILKIN